MMGIQDNDPYKHISCIRNGYSTRFRKRKKGISFPTNLWAELSTGLV